MKLKGINNYLKRTLKSAIMVDSIVITVLTFVISAFIIENLSGLFSVDPTEQSADVLMSDIYYSVAKRRSVDDLNSDIVLVGVDDCSRGEIAALIDAVNYAEAKVIGVDVLFEVVGNNQDDANLIEAINGCDNIVMPVRLEYNSTDSTFSLPSIPSIYSALQGVEYGVVNLPSNKSSLIRYFKPFFKSNIIELNSFAAAITQCFDSVHYNKLVERNNELEDINYMGAEFEVFDAYEIIDENLYPRPQIESFLKDKIVLIGDLNNSYDMHITPMGDYIPGIIIHAKIVDTVLGDNYIESSSNLFNIWISIIFCFAFAYINLKSKLSEKWNNIEGLLIRVLQMGLVYLFMVIGCYWFINRALLINFSQVLVMICNSALITDIWLGVKELYAKRDLCSKAYVKFKSIIKRK